jgi:hypothetical protein
MGNPNGYGGAGRRRTPEPTQKKQKSNLEGLTKDQTELLDRPLAIYPGAAAYGPDHDPRVHDVAEPLVHGGWVERFEDELEEAVEDGTMA